jgi:LysM repeat protein
MSDKYDGLIRDALGKAQEKYGLGSGEDCFRIVKAMIETESSFDPNAVSSVGARGLMQVMKAAAEEMGFKHDDMFDPQKNIECGVLYLAKYMKVFFGGDCWQAIAGYNAGPGRVKEAGGDLSKLPKETQDYVRKVKERMKKYGAVADPSGTAAVASQLKNIREKNASLKELLELLDIAIKAFPPIPIKEGGAVDSATVSNLKQAIEGLSGKIVEEVKALDTTGNPMADEGGKKEGDGKKDKPVRPKKYTIKKGDTLSKIAKEFGVKPADLEAANPGIKPTGLQPGQEINIP